jgi:hypothetical protein
MRIPLGPMENSYVLHWTYLCPFDPMDNWNVHWTYACPMDPLDPMDHWTYTLCHLTGLLTCMGSMPTYDVIELNYLPHNQMSTGHMPVHWIQWTKSNVHWTYLCPLDPMDNSNVHWTYACPMDPLDPMDHWTYTLCHLTGLLTCMGSMLTYDVIELTYLPHNQMSTGHMPVHWIQWTNQMSTGHFNMSIGHLAEVLDINHLFSA